MIDYRPDLFAQRQKLLAGEMPAAAPEPIMSITVKRTQHSTSKVFLRTPSGADEIPTNKIDWFEFGRSDSFQVDIEAHPLPSVWEVPSFAVLEDFPTLRLRIEALEANPLSEIDAISAEEFPFTRRNVKFWPFTYELTPGNGKYGRHQSLLFNLVVGDDALDSGELMLHESFACKVVDYLQAIGLCQRCRAADYPLLLPYISRGFSWRELELFLEQAKQFASRLRLYLTFTKEIDTIYRNAYRSNLDGTADLNKVESDVAKFLKRESVVPSHMEKWERESIAEDVAWIAARHLGERPSRVEHVGILFEDRVAKELENLGYMVDRTPVTGDFGADLIAEKDDLRYAIQCKSHAKPIGLKAVQEAVGARRYYKCDYGVVIASSPFTLAAKELAGETGVILIGESSISRLESMSG
ncbi:restriction endonuclease [Sinorhizobium meliloti]|uniref:restriction endonuclease n=1 Tax=Rhizobium meliloti TaxID=382 RepID=UPI000FD75FA2|nr:restriction endonuclease [Sinorhizobium meliloti]MDE3795824.1 restriction endonuclease [Sinorhizobium meliloti]RVK58246.1 restriction endonuclease [Sinorhizobium meliloti]